MRSRLLITLALSSAMVLPAMASSVETGHNSRAHKRHTHLHHVAAASPCGRIAGHARHTVLANPSAIPCRASRAREVRVRERRVPKTGAHLERAALAEPRTTARTVNRVALNRIRWVPPLRGSLESLMRQNQRDEAEGLVRIEDDAQLDQMESAGDLVQAPASGSLRVNPDLPMDRRYCRPWTARFLADLAASHYGRFHRPLQLNSAVRTVAFQRHLLMINGNAAPAAGDIASPHLTGAAVDIGKHGLSLSEIAWMRAWLLPLQTAGKIDVEEEFYQSCFHITVYRSYVRPTAPRTVARRRRSTTTLLATSVR
ncbi:MAG TPA: DUF5715 family protein [Acidobacteriaceae bacterium]|jgi:hypothetical protein|nr:DUF5715 family protein [Acidobacteriaceae bacterium]